jgi:thiol-disulfide isomerase/thioredoxin
VLAAGCSPEQSVTGSRTIDVSDDTVTDSTDQQDVSQPAAEISLMEADIDTYEDVLKRYAGKVVLVDFWATWCVPCKKSFPKILQYGRDYLDHGLAVVSVSFDDASEQEDVLDFLKSVDAAIPNLISRWGAGTESMERFGVESALPYYKLYDRSGKLRWQFSDSAEGLDNVESADQMKKRIEELLRD